MDYPTWREWLDRHAPGETINDRATTLGVNGPTLNQWVRHGRRPSAENVIKMARHLGVDVLDALVAAEYLTIGECGQAVTTPTRRKSVRVPNPRWPAAGEPRTLVRKVRVPVDE